MNRAGGTPVFVENSGGLDPRKLLMRLKDERIRGKKMCVFCACKIARLVTDVQATRLVSSQRIVQSE